MRENGVKDIVITVIRGGTMLNDGLMTWIFIILNIGMPIMCLVMFKKALIEKNSYLTGIGAIFPSLLFHATISIEFHLNNLSGPDSFAYHAQWVMAGWVGPFLASLFFVIRRFIFKNLGKLTSFLFGLFPSAVIYLSILL